ncbi:MAG: hypothetical protein ABIJ08_05345 [Nanoarchaeota archaeon]
MTNKEGRFMLGLKEIKMLNELKAKMDKEQEGDMKTSEPEVSEEKDKEQEG